MLTEIVQVEIIRPWWDDALPLIAIALSLGTLFWTVWDRSRGRAKLKIQERSYEHGPDGTGHFLRVAVRNRGRIDSTSVSSANLFLPSSLWAKTGMIVHPLKTEQSLPLRLQPGDALDLYFDVDKIRKELAYYPDVDGKLKRLSGARVEIEAGHGDVSKLLSKWARRYLAGDGRHSLLVRFKIFRQRLPEHIAKRWHSIFQSQGR